MAETTLMCPKCGSWAQLSTREVVPGLSRVNVVTRDEQGSVNAEHGDSEMYWDDSKTTGVECGGCKFEYDGDDWSDQLKPVPALSRIVEVVVADIESGTDPQDRHDRVRAVLVSDPLPRPVVDPRVTLLLELVECRAVGFPEDLATLCQAVEELLPTVDTTLAD